MVNRRQNLLLFSAFLLLIGYYVIQFLPPKIPESDEFSRRIQELGGTAKRARNGEIDSVTLQHVTDDTDLSFLRKTSESLASLSFEASSIAKGLDSLGEFPHLEELRFSNCDLSSELPAINFPSLRWLIISESNIGNTTFANLTGSGLEVLNISHSNLSENTCQEISSIGTLSKLLISSTPIRDRDAKPFNRLTNLRRLYLFRTNLTGDFFSDFSDNSLIEYIDVRYSNFDSVGCKNISRFTHLKFLDAANSKVTDIGVNHLAGLQNLEFLGISGTDTTNASISVLCKFPRLKTIMAINTPLEGVNIQRNKSGDGKSSED